MKLFDAAKLTERSLLKVGFKIIIDANYRRHMFSMISAYTGKTDASSDKELSSKVKNYSYYAIGGCELHPIVEDLRKQGVRDIYLTFENNAKPLPHFEVSDRNAECYKRKYDVFILSQAQDFRSLMAAQQTGKMGVEELKLALAGCLRRMDQAIEYIMKCNNSATIFLYGYAVGYRPALGISEYKSISYTNLDLQIDYRRGLYGLGYHYPSVFVYDHAINNTVFSSNDYIKTHSADGIYDHLSAKSYSNTVVQFSRLLELVLGREKRVKCLVCDLDNTLWKGIIRDDGKEGISVHYNTVNILQMLSRRGVIIALCSKNDEFVADELESVLGEDFMQKVSATRINWLPKSDNIQALSKILNIGLDSMAFVDDSQYEREQVASSLPEVRVYKETDFYSMLTDVVFEPEGAVTSESSARVQMYKEQARRNEAELTFDGGFEAFLRDCKMKVYMHQAKEAELIRVVELIQRTNQLNTSIRRYTKAEVIEMHGNKKYKIYTLRVKDRFGEYGLVGVVVVQIENQEWFISLLLLSCRVMGRNIESFMFDYVKQSAKESGASLISLEYNSTDRNQAMQKIVMDNGFEKCGNGRYLYQLKENEIINLPDYFEFLKI